MALTEDSETAVFLQKLVGGSVKHAEHRCSTGTINTIFYFQILFSHGRDTEVYDKS